MHRLLSFWTGVALTGLGVSLTMLGVGGLLESRWVVDPLRYHQVIYSRGFRGPPSIRVVTRNGDNYYLPERLWKGRYEGPALAGLLRQDSLAAVRVRGGESRLLYGYPVVESLEAGSLRLDALPERVSPPLRLLLGSSILLAGLLLVWRAARTWRRAAEGGGSPDP